MSSSSDQPSLTEIRQHIDALDRQILTALEQRAALASAVVAAKGGKAVFRPGREADLIRGLVSATSLSPQMIEVIWRQIIANNISSQQRLNIAMTNDDQIRSSASFCFGATIDQQIKSSPGDVIEAIADDAADLGLLAHWQDDPSWLDALGQYQGHVYIIAITPFIQGQAIAGTVLKDAAILSRQLPDPSSADITLSLDNGKLVERDGYHADAAGLIGIFQKR